MLRKLRFFKDQIHKADIPSSACPSMEPDIELEELEVYLFAVILHTDNETFLSPSYLSPCWPISGANNHICIYI